MADSPGRIVTDNGTVPDANQILEILTVVERALTALGAISAMLRAYAPARPTTPADRPAAAG